MPISHRKPEVSNYDFLCALLYIIENGCKRRALPTEYGNWHTIYVKDKHFLLMDRAYEDNEIRELAVKQGFVPVDPPKRNRKNPWEYDKNLYKRRNEVERYFLHIKRFRRVFTRYDKLDIVFLSVIMLAMIFDALFM